ncbi:unnamed protein product [Darwinula stevensoni]|uniref:Uncharacterized protein n=1 Tax=Darwinula stevensoni TaxID=69355 RepID=A0A7R9FSY7_9CRUS|nr:unnamed protein product [Darwinula stevensoni]CAG0904517.1 unnamed protein product [Darwinula stevensoni]
MARPFSRNVLLSQTGDAIILFSSLTFLVGLWSPPPSAEEEMPPGGSWPANITTEDAPFGGPSNATKEAPCYGFSSRIIATGDEPSWAMVRTGEGPWNESDSESPCIEVPVESLSYETTLYVAIGSLIYSFLMITIGFLCIDGVRTRRRKLMLPWLWITFLELLAGFGAFAYAFALATTGITGIGFLVLILIFTVLFSIDGYCLLVVYSHFKVLRGSRKSPGKILQGRILGAG